MTTRSITQIPATFSYQSYLTDTYLAGGILKQSPGDAIVASTLRQAQTPGVGVALHPSSDSPIAIRFKGGQADSATLILTPGQILRVGAFKTFEWGLPFGWLGGGNVVLYVLHDDKAAVEFPNAGNPVIFHRARYIIDGPGYPGTLRQNWPGTFPWQAAVRTPTPAQPQGGQPIMEPTMDVALCRLFAPAVLPATPVTLSLVWQGADAFDLDNADVLTTTTLSSYELSFPASPSAAGNVYPLAWIPPEIHRLTSSVGGLNFVDPTGVLAGYWVDVVRYCRF